MSRLKRIGTYVRCVAYAALLCGLPCLVEAQDPNQGTPKGVQPEAWIAVLADIEARLPRSGVMSAGIFPIPVSGCPGISAAESEAEVGSLLRLFAPDAPPCSLVVMARQSDMIAVFVYVLSEGEWQRWERPSER